LLAAAGPELGLTYDVGNWLLADTDPLVALERLAPRIAHVHLKDWRVEPDRGQPAPGSFLGLDGRRYISAALGEGIIDLAGALAALRRLGYHGYASIEYEGLDDPAPPLRRGVAHARRLLENP
jgi:sugar phosphate isomerase/epimerase